MPREPSFHSESSWMRQWRPHEESSPSQSLSLLLNFFLSLESSRVEKMKFFLQNPRPNAYIPFENFCVRRSFSVDPSSRAPTCEMVRRRLGRTSSIPSISSASPSNVNWMRTSSARTWFCANVDFCTADSLAALAIGLPAIVERQSWCRSGPNIVAFNAQILVRLIRACKSIYWNVESRPALSAEPISAQV